MSETKSQTQILSGNFEHHIILKKMQEWIGTKVPKQQKFIPMSAPEAFKTLKIRLMIFNYERTKVTHKTRNSNL